VYFLRLSRALRLRLWPRQANLRWYCLHRSMANDRAALFYSRQLDYYVINIVHIKVVPDQGAHRATSRQKTSVTIRVVLNSNFPTPHLHSYMIHQLYVHLQLTCHEIRKFFPGFDGTLSIQYHELKLINIVRSYTMPWRNINNLTK